MLILHENTPWHRAGLHTKIAREEYLGGKASRPDGFSLLPFIFSWPFDLNTVIGWKGLVTSSCWVITGWVGWNMRRKWKRRFFFLRSTPRTCPWIVHLYENINLNLSISSYHSSQFKYKNSHIFACIIHLVRVHYELTKRPGTSCIDSSVGRALHRYRRGHRFESRTGFKFTIA